MMKSLLLLICLVAFSVNAEDDFPLKIGNFSLPTSQQPGPLVGIGENIIDKGQTQVFIFADATVGNKNYRTDVIPSILYAFTDEFSIFINFPVAPSYKEHQHHSSGLEDFYVQLEYAFYNTKDIGSTVQATVVGNITFPTGSSSKKPPTGFGSPSFLAGTTINYMTFDWFYFGSLSGILHYILSWNSIWQSISI